jgi:hypothetical protein
MDEHDIALPEMAPFGQGYKDMGPAVDEFERRLLGLAQTKATTIDPDVEDAEIIAESTVETLRHDGNPVMTWCAGNARGHR